MLTSAARVAVGRPQGFLRNCSSTLIPLRAASQQMSSAAKATGAGGGSSGQQQQQQQQQGGFLEQISVIQLQEMLSNPVTCEEVQFVDVREPWEHDIAKLPYFKLFPLSQASNWSQTITEDLDLDKQTVVLCHHGVRSMQMCQFLVSQGFDINNVKNVSGGIAAFSKMDNSIPEY